MPDTHCHLNAGDGDEVLANGPGTPVDTNGIKGADATAPSGTAVTTDPNGELAVVTQSRFS